jgi:hypothetical protein
MEVRRLLTGVVALGLAVLACLAVWPTFDAPVKWTPDGLYYQARVLEIRGTGHDAALRRTFEGPISAKLRARDPQKTGNPAWVKYNEPFYERRLAVPLAAAALYPFAGDRSLLYLSLAGYIASILALFGLLLLRFRLAIAATVSGAAAFLPPLVHHSSYPLTDSWGLALETVAFAAALLTLERGGRRWLLVWIATILLLSFVRDSTWIPVLAAGWCALRFRTRESVSLFATGVAAALPVLLVFSTPARDLLALLVNHSEVPSDPSWGFVVSHYPRAVFELVRANVGFLRRGEWYTAFFLVGGVIALLVLLRKRLSEVWPSLLTAGVVVAFGYVLAAPVFSAFRLELVFVPMAAYGLALATERVAAHAGERGGALERVALRIPVRTRRS